MSAQTRSKAELGIYIINLMHDAVLSAAAPVLKAPPSQNVHLPTAEFMIPFGSVIARLCRY